MFYIILAFASVPSIILLVKHPDQATEVIIQLAIVLAFFYVGYLLIKGAASCVKLLGYGLLIFGLIAYYYLAMQPFSTGEIFGPKF